MSKKCLLLLTLMGFASVVTAANMQYKKCSRCYELFWDERGADYCPTCEKKEAEMREIIAPVAETIMNAFQEGEKADKHAGKNFSPLKDILLRNDISDAGKIEYINTLLKINNYQSFY